ncbi:MAG: aldehyde dehydrogenase family protein [Prolixibacteraceae bacterium]|jgi:aldehyde dehydrogenase (NAD+)|nr:aldehyde dehydrogenase family protein [Bacteroidota bacterium]NLS99202.1 aldehyde dehydrogenase family protein [Bacteroidales bacterium]OQB78688.1 MAG: Aldehyde dehydrogenase, thermostable [Bacteroidetes bacterium ADurb.Bin123]HNZ68040.1 aldehyde dehydrogenase family protein [Prolixibacteraceae bacterium]HOC85982.1 aldehyde dehydrogenase family protein [Prolixibacteraceae bacterium]
MHTDFSEVLAQLGIEKVNPGLCTGTTWQECAGDLLTSCSPADGKEIASIRQATLDDYNKTVELALRAFTEWRKVPAPRRGEVVRQIGLELRKYKEPLGRLVSYEMGKIYQEGLGEVQEMIDICDFAVGQSRQLYGFTMQSERPGHRMYDQYHPLGLVGVVSAFNFPVAVWAWNAMIALIAGDVVLWKPSSKVLLCAIAVHKIVASVLRENNVPEGVLNLVATSSKYLGDDMFSDPRIPLISFTGSTKTGKKAGRLIGERLGKSILELGGNNAIIITPKANPELALRAVIFGAVGTCGQRCTSTRRIILHESLFDEFSQKLVNAYRSLKIGHPLDPSTHVGPLIDCGAKKSYLEALARVKAEGGKILCGGEELTGEAFSSGCYVVPAIAEVENHYAIVQEETFAPLLYLIRYKTLDEAIALHNAVPQGLSSAIFTTDLLEAEQFLSGAGSDCGIANVNIGTSGAEIGGAFGGEKDTGGGRESGSDAWKAYMRRQTNTINYSTDLPLAQGIKFDI